MKYLSTILLLLVGHFGSAQFVLKGTIKDADSKAPIANASVFITNSKIGVTTSVDGEFSLTIPQGKYDLIFSNIGYETQVVSVDEKSPKEMPILLKQKQRELESVTVVAFERDGWKKYGQLFMDNFIGNVTNTANCKLKNPELVKFRKSKKDNTITAIAFEPLELENKALGYVLKYQLEEFNYNYNTNVTYFEGYPLFIDMPGTEAEKKQWEINRQKAYYGSILHFMRAVYNNKLTEEGFEIRKMTRGPNKEKQRIQPIISMYKRDSTANPVVPDSLKYYTRILRQPDIKDNLFKDLLPYDSIAYKVDSSSVGMYFTDYLHVTYKNAKPEQKFMDLYKGVTVQASQVIFTTDAEVLIWENGSYYPARNILSAGYWGWSEKAGNMLPMDYVPEKK